MIVHIIQSDKFTNGYIDFMINYFQEINHIFFVPKGKITLIKNRNIIELEHFGQLLIPKYFKYLIRTEKIIVSGVWFSLTESLFLCFPQIIKKTYFHFWGGDFYMYDHNSSGYIPIKSFENYLSKLILFNSFKKAAGLVFLIKGEYERFEEITRIHNKYYIAPMPGRLSEPSLSGKFYFEGFEHSKKILVGNSATKTNNHIEVFELLKKYINEDFVVICPLSYGDEDIYKEKVLNEGKKIFGDKFFPILDFMEPEDYSAFLSQIDIGVFFNDRQQAMGNINLLLRFGKKVYLREGTSMWNNYVNNGYILFSTNNINMMDYYEFCEYDNESKKRNMNLLNEDVSYEKFYDAWSKIINS